MEKEFVPYKEALALKELGFNERCLSWYSKKKLHINDEISYNSEWDDSKDCCAAPLYQQAFRWFREKHNLNSHIIPSDSIEDYFCFDITELDKSEPILNIVFEGTHKESMESYEELELACLRKLIEILKTK